MYLDQYIGYGILSTVWEKIGQGNAAFLANNDCVKGRIPKQVNTAWEYTTSALRVRYEYTYEAVYTEWWGSLWRWTFTVVDASGAAQVYQRFAFENITGQSENCWFIGDVNVPSSYGPPGFDPPYWETLQGWFDFYGIPVPSLPAMVSVECSRIDHYLVKWREQICVGPLCTDNQTSDKDPVDFVQTVSGATFTVEARPLAVPLLVDGECSVTSLPLYPDSGGEGIYFTATIQNSTDQSLESYPCELWIEVLGIREFLCSSWDQPAASWGKTTSNFPFFLRTILGREPGAGESYTIRLKVKKADIVTDYIDFALSIQPAPAPNPHIVSALSYISDTTWVEPDQVVSFHIVIEREVALVNHQSGWGYLALLCHGQVRTLWSGIFPSGDPPVTRVSIDFSATFTELYGVIPESQYILVEFISGSGTVDVEHYVGYMPFSTLVHVTPTERGAIQVASDPAGASFSLAGPANYAGVTPWSIATAPVGEYCISWGAMEGRTKPTDSCKILAASGTVSFEGVYQEGEQPPAGGKAGLVMGAAGLGLVAYGLSRRKK